MKSLPTMGVFSRTLFIDSIGKDVVELVTYKTYSRESFFMDKQTWDSIMNDIWYQQNKHATMAVLLLLKQGLKQVHLITFSSTEPP